MISSHKLPRSPDARPDALRQDAPPREVGDIELLHHRLVQARRRVGPDPPDDRGGGR
jgi:hypothetical protein